MNNEGEKGNKSHTKLIFFHLYNFFNLIFTIISMVNFLRTVIKYVAETFHDKRLKYRLVFSGGQTK